VKKFLLAALLVATVVPAAPGAHATEYPPLCGVGVPPNIPPTGPRLPCGQTCTFNSSTDVTKEAGWQVGVMRGGPLVTGEAGTLHCSIHVNNDLHSGAELASADYGTVGDLVVVGALNDGDLLHYQATAADDVSLCSKWTPTDTTHETLYWVSGNTLTLSLGHWSTNPNASCGVATSIEPNDPECSIWLAIDQRLGTNIAEIWQDCEPYSPII